MAATLLTLILGVCLVATVAAVCPNRYVDPGKTYSRCFKFAYSRKTWEEARTDCLNNGGDLMSIRSIHEKTWLEGAWKRHQGVNSAWTGLESPKGPNQWEWSDGTPFDPKLVKWSTLPLQQQCTRYFGGGFFPTPCSSRLSYICTRSKDVPVICPLGWTHRDNHCYKYQDIEKPWTQARLDCGYYGGDLVDVQTKADQNFVQSLALTGGRTAWLGLRTYKNDGVNNTDFVWVTGDYNTKVTFWAKGEPRIISGEETNSCLQILAINETQNWALAMCNSTRPYICKRPSGGCEPGWRLFHNHCFRIYTGDDKKAWPEAQRFCAAQNSALLTIKEVMRQVFMMRYLKIIKESGSETMWLGAKYTQAEKELRWVTGEKVTYQNWRPEQPQYATNRNSCLQMRTDGRDGLWEMNNNCLLSMAFTCYAPTGVSIIDSTPAPPEKTCDFELSARENCESGKDLGKEECESRDCCYDPTNRPNTDLPKCYQKKDSFICPPDWSLHGSSCYKSNIGPQVGWVAARRQCADISGDLADIRDEETQIFLIRLHNENSWIGLNDRTKEGKYVWLDEADAANWTNWAPEQPDDNGGRRKNCVYAEDGMWVDEDCGKPKGYVCKIAATPHGILPTTTPSPNASRCGDETWIERPNTDWCYQVNRPEVTWYDAREACEDHGGYLTSITTNAESSFLRVIGSSLVSAEIWVGLDGLHKPGMWRWVDKQPFLYYDWAEGEPTNAGECGAILKSNRRWKTQKCIRTNSYICKRLVPDVSTTLYPQTTLTPATGSRLDCPVGTHSFRGHCYSFIKKAVTWKDAQTECRKLGTGADLVTISEQRDQDFVFSKSRELFGGNPQPWRVWIGLFDRAFGTRHFFWSDKSKITYTNWDANEPSNHNEHCVDFWLEHGRWNDEKCDFKAVGFVCRQPPIQLPVTPPGTVTPPGCRAGFNVAYMDSCYRTEHEPSSWEGANDFCFNQGGFVLDILDESEQHFVSSYLVRKEDRDYWIGLGRQADSQWQWTSGKPTTYTNWDRHIGDEGCAAIRSREKNTGRWKDFPCAELHPFVCKATNSLRGTRVPRTTIAPNVLCAKGWKTLGDYCYKAFGLYRNKRTWLEARDYCRQLGGDLGSIHDPITNTNLRSLTSSRVIWIGINSRDPQFGLVWSDGRSVEFTKWLPGEPNSHNNQEQCGSYSGYIRINRTTTYRNSWSLNTCSVAQSFVCGLLRGRTPNPTPPPMTPPTSVGCGEKWLRRQDWCYYFSENRKQMKTWRAARTLCMQSGGDLASIKGPEENDFIKSIESKLNGNSEMWLGLNELDLDGYKWSDKTPVTFLNWARNQPNDENHAQRCVKTSAKDGFWRDDNCGVQLRYVCKKRPDTFTPMTTLPTPTIPGFCPQDGFSVGNKCMYVVHGYSNTSKSWDDAQRACVSTYGKRAALASINSEGENLVLNLYMEINTGPYWIGLNDKARYRKWQWVDNSDFNYASWSNGEPRGRGGRNRQPCVEIKDGRWFTEFCDQTRGYVCQIPKNPEMVVSTPPSVDTTGCPDSTYTKLKGDCYKIFKDSRRWSDARTACITGNMELASIDSYRLNSLLAVMGSDAGIQNKFWIGFYDVKEPGVYRWSDQSLVLYTSWARRQPVRPSGGGCVAADNNGGWFDTICDYALPYACKYTRTPTHTAPPDVIGSCPANEWYPLGSFCYLLPESNYVHSYARAQAKCKADGAQLTSIHSAAVNTFIFNYLLNERRAFNAWIGMVKKGDKFTWDDGSPVGYTNWAPGPIGRGEDCVMMEKKTGLWRPALCTRSRLYVCKALKDGIPTTTVTPSPPVTKPGLPAQPCQYDPLGFARGDSCYRFITRMKVVANYADYECKKLNGNLVSLHSLEENNFVKELLGTRKPPAADAWIGYIRTDGGLWMWQDRTASGYTNWETGQPGRLGHRCAVISSVTGRWSDRKCDEFSTFVCKFKSVPPPTGPTLPTPKPTFSVDDCPGRKGAYQMGDYCYQVTMDDIKRQEHARQVCRVKGGELTSIHDHATGSYLLQLVSRDQTIEKQNLWVGLVRTRYLCEIKSSKRVMCGALNITRQMCLARDCCYDTEDKHTSNCYKPLVDPRGKFEWRWTDTTRYDFTNWAKGYPTPFQEDAACVDFSFLDGTWRDAHCLEQRGYICRYPFGVQVPTTINVEQCPFRSDAILQGDYCYHVTTTTIINRASARAQCQMLGGDLASIHDEETNRFVLYDLMRMDGEVDVWIGLEKASGKSFIWSDTTRVAYTNWGPGEPSLKGECVKMATVTGKWMEVDCAETNGVVCKYPVGQTIQPTTPAVRPTFVVEPCPGRDDAIAFGDFCYHINYNDAMSWTSALQRCQNLAPGAQFASLHSQDENRYILQDAIRRQSPQDLWIGAVGLGKNWHWSDGTDMDYLNWSPEAPVVQGACSVMDKSTGMWKDANCFGLYVYACKFSKASVTPKPTLPTLAPCPFRQGAYLLGDYCFQTTTSDLQRQIDARQSCRVRGGELASVHNTATMQFIQQIWTSEQDSQKNNLWIGLVRTRYSCTVDLSRRTVCPYTAANISRQLCLDRDCCFDRETPNSPRCYQSDADPRGKYEWKWTDTTTYDFTNWAPGFPSILQQDACVETDYTTGQWRDSVCSERRGYVCRYPMGFPVKTTIKFDPCPFNIDAVLLGDYCYHVVTKSIISRASARAQCQMKGGDLTSIHDARENRFVLNDLMRKNGPVDLWIGLVKKDGKWAWSDTTRTDYYNWGPGEPSLKGECVKMASVSGKWIEVSCGMTNGYVCRYPMGEPIKTTTPAMRPTFSVEPCPFQQDAISFGDYCYSVTPNNLVSWASASLLCQRFGDGADLLSLHDREESDYILQEVIRKQSPNDLWIGAASLATNWRWSDGTSMDFLNWAPNMPIGTGQCSRMDKTTGTWKDTDCYAVYGYVCRFPIGAVTTKPTYPAVPCPSRPDAFLYNGACYDISRYANLDQGTSRRVCLSRGGDLSSFHSQQESEFVHYMANRQVEVRVANLWIGLVRTDSNGPWTWLDGTPVDFTYWAGRGPTPDGNCADMDKGSGRWLNLECDKQRGYVCKYTVGITHPPTTAITTPKRCPIMGSEWWELGQYCYYVSLTDRVSQKAASDYCKYGQTGGHLVSIHSPSENGFLFNLVKRSGAAGAANAWLGLQKIGGSWQWTDGTSVDYSNWSPGRPLGGTCVDMDRSNGMWMDIDCDSYRGYSCKFSEDMPTSPMSTTPFIPSNKCSVKGARWWEQGKNCYLVSLKTSVSQSIAYYNCKYGQDRGNLVSIHSASENGFVLSLVQHEGAKTPTNTWIGMRKENMVWRWVDGTPMDYMNWAPGHPLPSHGGFCAEMDRMSGMWLDIDCDSQRGYSCKYPEGTTKTSALTTATTPMTTQRRTLPWTRAPITRQVTSPQPATPIIVTVHPVTGLSAGATAGVVVGTLLAVTLIIFLLILIIIRVRGKKTGHPNPGGFSLPAAFSFNNQLYSDDTTVNAGSLTLEDLRNFSPGSTDS